ncbi:MAG: prolyl oligopeptidase family serine peptidase [Planctomycetaceae bacterium]|nr:prolyl oligopeptidase family serine peptidase [Planctomycetaceae bacterium]
MHFLPDTQPRPFWWLLVALWCFATTDREVFGQEPVKELILPGESFLIGDRAAFILWPEPAKRRDPQPWVMYAPTLPAYPDTHERWMHQKFLDAGVAVAGIDVGEAYGSPNGNEGLTALYEHLIQKRGFAAKPVLFGRSRGGLWVSSWAIKNPDKVAGIIAIYPVFDLTTYPGVEKAAPAFGLTSETMSDQLQQWNPIAGASVLPTAKIPVAIIHGDVDTVVPLEQNSQTLARIYADAGEASLMSLEVVSGQGHNFWQGFFRSQSLVDQAIRWATRN